MNLEMFESKILSLLRQWFHSTKGDWAEKRKNFFSNLETWMKNLMYSNKGKLSAM